MNGNEVCSWRLTTSPRTPAALSAGFFTLLLARRGLTVHVSRLVVYLIYALFASLAIGAAFLPAGPLLLAVLLLVGFGALGVMPAYYSFSQDLTVKHQGMLTGVLGCLCWLGMAVWQEMIGHIVEYTKSYTLCMILAGAAPLIGFAALNGAMGKRQRRQIRRAGGVSPLILYAITDSMKNQGADAPRSLSHAITDSMKNQGADAPRSPTVTVSAP